MTQDHKLLHCKQIALTKIQNWRRIDDNSDGNSSHIKIMLLGEQSNCAYFDYLNDIGFHDLVKLIY